MLLILNIGSSYSGRGICNPTAFLYERAVNNADHAEYLGLDGTEPEKL